MSVAETIADKLGELFALQEERVRAQIAAGLAETTNALRLQGARSVNLTGTTTSIWRGPGRLAGYSLACGAGGPATVTVYDARPESITSDTPVLAVVSLAAGTSSTNFMGGGVSITEACTAVVAGVGAVTGAIYLGAKD